LIHLNIAQISKRLFGHASTTTDH